MTFYNYAQQTPWAISERVLETILSIAQRKNDVQQWVAENINDQMLETQLSEVRESVAIVSVVGPLFRYANIFTRISGATSYELIGKDMQALLANPDIHSIILNVDSPGGEVNGVSELAKIIYRARGIKPIYAYVSGDAASGAYWIASAADKIIVSDTAELGSIGVVATVRHFKDDNVIEIVSSQSPHKRPDVSTDAGKQRIQNRIDELAQVFIDSVAKHRGVDSAIVENEFGGGDVFIGKHAVTVGLADKLGSLDSVIEELNKKNNKNKKRRLDTTQSFPLHPAPSRGVSFLQHEKNTMTQHTSEPETPSPHSATTSAVNTPTDVVSLTAAYPQLVEDIQSTTHSVSFEQGKAEGKKEGEQAGIQTGKDEERQRIAAILGDDAAKGREQLAQHLAFSSDISVEMAVSTLNAAPVQQNTPTKPTSSFEQVMAGIQNPEIAPAAEDQEGEDDEQKKMEAAAQRIASYSVKHSHNSQNTQNTQNIQNTQKTLGGEV
ncbi:S49 family peptidase [Teredinibacter sp. KSP-S5-2]|uniref:S49 family peptidase n=1 Tax=Teredinibacter sp. KSP-S5-2 TaxID=3034506 RepID=UPI0029349B49|nr:S49 family peptidase [Teredinibacter sp. KSP-S5-2]WNO10539.1 S49 family peptidase [Teredinibacter sp. KSP-S5-2]